MAVVVAPIAVNALRRRILRKFEEAGANDAAHARTPAELDVQEGHLFGRIVKSGVLVSASEGRYYISAEGLARWRQQRNTAVLTATGLALVVVLVIWVLVNHGS